MITEQISSMRRAPLLAFFALLFPMEWALLLLLLPLVTPVHLLILGSWLPNLIGVLVTLISDGRLGLADLLNRVARWDFPIRWYATAIGTPLLPALFALAASWMMGAPKPQLAPADQLPLLLLAALFTGAIGEELGWRGTALPRLQACCNALISSLTLGVLWGLYHLPAFLIPGMPQNRVLLLPFMLAAIANTVLMTWIFIHTDSSLIPAFLYHGTLNFIGNAAGIFSAPALFWIYTWLLVAMSFCVIILDWSRFKQRLKSTKRRVLVEPFLP